MSALDEIETVAEVKQSETAQRRVVDSLDPAEVLEKRHARWEALMPEGLSDKQRDSLEASLDLAHFALGLSVNELAAKQIALQEKIAQEKGLEPDDPKVGVAVAIKWISEINKQSLEVDPVAGCSEETRKALGQASSMARALGWSPQQIGGLVQAALVQTEGDRDKAIAVFRSYISEESVERFSHGSISIDEYNTATLQAEIAKADGDETHNLDFIESRARLLESDKKPEMEPYPDTASTMLTVVTSDGAGCTMQEIKGYQDLREEVADDEIRARVADESVRKLNIIAAEILSAADYAVYRVIVDNAHKLGDKSRGKYNIENRQLEEQDKQKSVSQEVQESLGYKTLQGARDATQKVLQKLHAQELPEHEPEPSLKAAARLESSTEQIIAQVDNKRVREIRAGQAI